MEEQQMAEMEPTRKVTFVMGEDLWVKAKQRALDERVTLTALLLDGLKLRLAQKPKDWGGVFRTAKGRLRSAEERERFAATRAKKGGKS
jgi:hypothetical protein